MNKRSLNLGLVRNENRIDVFSCHSPKMGIGHMVRSEALSSHLRALGFRVRHFRNFDQAQFEGLIPRVRVFDCPAPAKELLKLSRLQGVRTLGLDYGESPAPDVVVSVMEHGSPLPGGKRYSGFEYAIIRDEIRHYTPRKDGYVVVSLGGSDILDMGPKIAAQLSAKGEKVVLVLGPLARQFKGQSNHLTLRNPKNFVQVLGNADWVVCNGGGTLFEAMSMEKPAYVVPQTAQEESVAAALMGLGGLLGYGSNLPPKLTEKKKVQVASSARNLIDGKGVNRVAEIVADLLHV